MKSKPLILPEEERKDIEVELVTAAYQAAVKIFETQELRGAIFGNGHHAAQKVAEIARQELHGRWLRCGTDDD